MKPKLAILILVLFIGSCLTASAWWKRSWVYRKEITIDNTGNSSVLTNYQVCFTNGFTNLITEGKMKAGAADMRFVDSNDSTLLSHYVQMSEMQSSEKIPNGGMEFSKGGDPEMPTYWQSQWAVAGELIQEDVIKHSGDHSWHIVTTNSGHGMKLYVTAKTNQLHRLSIWVKGVSGDITVEYGGIGNLIWTWTPATNWTEYTTNWTTTAGHPLCMFYIYANNGAAEFYVDDVSVKEIYPAEDKVWVKVPSIPAGSTRTIYMYYGNANATSVASFDNTFTKDHSGESLSLLAGQWNMDEGSGSAVADSSGNAITGAFGAGESAPTWTGSEGTPWGGRTNVTFSTGNCLTFDGNNDYVDCGNDDSLNIPSNAVTAEAWINGLATNGWNYIVKKSGDGLGYHFNLRWEQGALHNGLKTVGQAWQDSWNDMYVTPSVWQHVVFTYDGTNKTMYLNGGTAPQDPESTGDIEVSTNNLTIGYSSTSYEGQIDEVRLYNRALSHKEIKCHYERRKYTEPEPSTSLSGEETVPPPQGTSFSIH